MPCVEVIVEVANLPVKEGAIPLRGAMWRCDPVLLPCRDPLPDPQQVRPLPARDLAFME